MLTVDFDRLGVRPGERVLDLGCGGGRHAFELYRRGARVVALDLDEAGLSAVGEMLTAMGREGQAPAGADGLTVHADALDLPFPDDHFDHVVAAEILEHVPEDERVMAEIVRVLRPGGNAAVTVPRWWPERVCWALSDAYHEVEGGHVRIYKERELAARLTRAGLDPFSRHHAHGLHSPYWWIRCAVGMDRADHPIPRLYHRLLVWDLMRRPLATRTAEKLLNPLVGKSLVLYLRKPVVGAGRAAA
ncbi:MAG: methyltransferase domain-containing protein [Nocardioidaceae bacterium]